MKLLSGTDLAGYIKERQAGQVQSLLNNGITPKLAIVQCKDDPVINTYVRLKKAYGDDLGIAVDHHFTDQNDAIGLLNKLNKDNSVHGVIVQLPLADPTQTDEIISHIPPAKDVDALTLNAPFEPATPMAILWLLAGYNIDLRGKKVLLVGRGKLVGGPLEVIFKNSGIDVAVADRSSGNLKEMSIEADVIITATGRPAILYPDMIKQGAIVVDAGVASEDGKTVGDLDPSVYERDDLTLTPEKGGVGPLTVCALFENVIRAARGEPK